jgi:enoyl-CoA hydratase/carnithine racemase
MSGSQMLSRLVGKHKGLELCSLGRQISFEKALELGLIHHVFEKSDYFQRVLEYAGLHPLRLPLGTA